MLEQSAAEKKLEIKKRTIKDLADYIRTRSGNSPNYCLFLGAGASVTSGIHTAVELVNGWRREIFTRLAHTPYNSDKEAQDWLKNHHPDWYEPGNEYSSLFEKKFDLPSQRRRFVELQVDKKLPSIGYAYLVELFESKCFDTVFTTNFDDLINEAFYQFSSDRPLLCAHDSSIKGISVTSSRPKIIKLHGDYLFDSIKSSLRETESLESNTKEKLLEFTKEYGLIFVGYAGNDNSIMDVLKFLLKQDDYLKNGIYWCKRKGDVISSELFKLLNHEKVYWVEIDGFDELMAELSHEMGKGLSLGGSNKSTKRERMISNFIKDEFELKKNPRISEDLKELRKFTYTQDISSLINELSNNDDNDSKIPEEDFKNLLAVDNLVRNGSYDVAEKEIITLLSSNVKDDMKAKYLHRLIDVYDDKGETKNALEQSDRLIALDEYNINYTFAKCNLLKESKEKIIYLRGLSDKFQYSIALKNELARYAINYLRDKHQDPIVTFKDIYSWIEQSFKQDTSLDNQAWRLKYDAIKSEHAHSFDKKIRDELTNSLLDTMKSINPTHDNYFYVYSSAVCDRLSKDAIIECINTLNERYEKSSRKFKKHIIKHLTQLHLCLFDLDTDDRNDELMCRFIDMYTPDKEESSTAPFLIFRARYEIGCNKNIAEGIKLAKEAMDSPWRNSYVEAIVDILLIDESNIEIVDEFLDSVEKDTSEILVEKLRSDIKIIRGDYKSALKHIENAYHHQWSITRYTMAKAYINLKAKNYQETIKIVNDNLEKVNNYRDQDVLIINREVAKKALGLENKKNELQSILSHRQSKGEVAMCAFFILGDELNAKKQLKLCIERDYMNLFRFRDWPALPASVLNQYTVVDKLAV